MLDDEQEGANEIVQVRLAESFDRGKGMKLVSWGVFEKQAPEMALFGKRRLDGQVAYLATVREDQRPRLHPVTPVIGEGHCFLFVEPSTPKAKDLLENGCFSLHCAMNDSSGSSGEFIVNGDVLLTEREEQRALARSICSYGPANKALLFELKINEVHEIQYQFGRSQRKKWTAE